MTQTMTKQNSKIAKNNAIFAKMTKAEKRVAIAKDALAQIKAKRYKAKSLTYVGFTGKNVIPTGDIPVGNNTCPENVELQSIFSKPGQTCQVCARGAMFVSACRVFDNIKVGDLAGAYNGGNITNIYASDFEDYENKFFDIDQVNLIESTFERWGSNSECSDIEDTEDADAARAYGRSFQGSEERMIGIFKNIIRNKGTFVIPKKFYK